MLICQPILSRVAMLPICPDCSPDADLVSIRADLVLEAVHAARLLGGSLPQSWLLERSASARELAAVRRTGRGGGEFIDGAKFSDAAMLAGRSFLLAMCGD